eukprot:scaffold7225_cov379-Prasinococcus_capsulatus_cf.AAC.12
MSQEEVPAAKIPSPRSGTMSVSLRYPLRQPAQMSTPIMAFRQQRQGCSNTYSHLADVRDMALSRVCIGSTTLGEGPVAVWRVSRVQVGPLECATSNTRESVRMACDRPALLQLRECAPVHHLALHSRSALLASMVENICPAGDPNSKPSSSVGNGKGLPSSGGDSETRA